VKNRLLPESPIESGDDCCGHGAKIIGQIDRCHDPIHAEAGLRRRITRGARLLVDGWAVGRARRRPPSRLLFLVDGMPCFLEEHLIERTDIAEYFGSQALCKCGFTAILPTEKLSIGIYELAICSVFDSTSAWSRPLELGSFNVVDCDTLDMPVTQTGAIAPIDAIFVNNQVQERGRLFNAIRGQTLVVVGWAIDELHDALPAVVFIELNQRQRFEALLGVERADVAAHFSNEHYRRAGYRCTIDTTSFQVGYYRGDVRVVMEASTVAYTAFAHFEFTISS
jgi:hypothetical protein